jgi:hypothetical protein
LGQQKKSIHQLKFANQFKGQFKRHFKKSEHGAALLEVLFTFVAQLFLSLGVIILFTQIARADILSFQEWKKLKVDQAQVQASQSNQIKVSESTPAAALTASNLSSGAQSKSKAPKLEASKLALQIAQDLSIEDYFALYLSQFHERSDFIDAAKKLSPAELADLLITLKSSLARDNSPDSPQSLSFSTLTTPSAPIKK